MREIKYRVWDKERKTYEEPILDGYVLTQSGVLFGSSVLDDWMTEIDEDSVILEQFTGLKDVNGEDIYEGTIVQPVRDNRYIGGLLVNIGRTFVVKSGNYAYGKWIAEQIEEDGFGVRNWHYDSELIAIGNVHDNPELLEG